ncbi:hypothetical protein [Curtobacterium sp. MCBD17_008]|uniref:hypothetical protein n=1 Tax=Curtobacterium sp. MCBD17_008 TaxID=2175656 RepID=UPI000DA8A0FC|nr:hypothetical protein [Curtobacterium sp. MCBD17_008]PZE89961.1 hypothetical protein DEI95_13140 [Curtobacterium sp. MCBD17_008]
MAGVPKDEITAHDFVMVRAALVQRLGGANEALVWTRIHFRCADGAHRHVDAEQQAWWPASSAQISAEVGLSEDQVDRALRALRTGGFVESTEHRLGGNYDRTKSWRPVVQESRGVDSAESRNGARGIADRTPRNRGQEPANSRDVPSNQTQKTEEDKNTLEDLFEEAWKCWPRKAGKKGAKTKFMRLVLARTVSREQLVEAIRTHGAGYEQWVQPQYVPHLTTWLNGERWEDEVPGPRGGRGEKRLAESVALVRRLREEEDGHAGIGNGAAAALGAGR